MRTVAGSQKHADWLITLGNRTHPRIPSLSPGVIEIPQDFLILDQKLETLIHHVFGNPARLLDHDVVESISNRAILCPKNRDCLNINN
uniref:Uncharacterized protein n=1 Tax=Daphnia galeata TaxID=27404 RepID=A0A8J2WAB5_9CRUS|nr:unnamed protein product [Daphnia galeata]